MVEPFRLPSLVKRTKESRYGNQERIGADGVHVGTGDKVEAGHIKLTKKDSGEGAHKATTISSTGGLLLERGQQSKVVGDVAVRWKKNSRVLKSLNRAGFAGGTNS